MRSRIFSKKTIQAETKGHLWLPSAIMLAYFFAFCIVSFMILQNKESVEMVQRIYRNLWKDTLWGIGMVVTVIAAVCSAIDGYYYLYSKKKVDFYHSLPEKRNRTFVKKTIYAICYFVFPYLCMECLAIGIGLLKGMFTKELFFYAGMMALAHFLTYLLVYFSTVLVVAMTGTYLMGILSMFGLFLYGPLSGLILKLVKEEFYRTYIKTNSSLETLLTEWGSPVTASIEMVVRVLSGKYSSLFGILIATILMATLAYIAYTRRPLEKTGNSLVYKWSENILTWMMTILGSVILGMLFYAINNESVLWGIFGILFGGILIHGVMQILLTMNFLSFLQKKGVCAVSLLSVLVFGSIVYLDLTGFDKKFPDYDKLESICIQDQYTSYNSIVTENDEVIHSYMEEYLEYCDVDKTPELYEVLKELVQNQGNAEHAAADFKVCYKLTSGRQIYRHYYADQKKTDEIKKYFYDQKSQRERLVNFMKKIDSEALTFIRYSTVEQESGKYLFVRQDIDLEKLNQLIEAIYQDVMNASGEDLIGEPIGTLSFEYEEPYLGMDSWIYIYPEYKNTIAFLGGKMEKKDGKSSAS